MDYEIVQTALRILNAYVAYEVPGKEDVARLRAAAREAERELPADTLATRMIEREIEKQRTERAEAAGGRTAGDGLRKASQG